ncbi:MAG: hypothetical protein ABWZ99_16320 [Ilumatobacteraceae bacterium]
MTLLEAAGFRVAPPGDNTTALPCVVLSPVALRIEPGVRILYHEIDICPAVPASPWEEQYAAAVDMAQQVCLTLVTTSTQQFVLGSPFPLETDTDRATPAMFHRINVRFAGPDLCPPTP